MGTKENCVLPSQAIAEMVEKKHIRSEKGIARENIQSSTLDLSMNTGGKLHVIEPGDTHYLPIHERLDLPCDIHVSDSSKSTLAKLGLITEILDEQTSPIKQGYSGKLIARVTSRNYHVGVYEGGLLGQIMLSNAPLSECRVDAAEHVMDPQQATIIDGKLVMHIKLDVPDDERYVSRESKKVLHLVPGYNNPFDHFFEDVPSYEQIRLKAGKLYLYLTKEKLGIKSGGYPVVARMPKMDPTGNLRINGAEILQWPSWNIRKALEIMPEIDTILKNDSEVCEVEFYRLLEVPDRTYGVENGNINNKRLMSSMIRMY